MLDDKISTLKTIFINVKISILIVVSKNIIFYQIKHYFLFFIIQYTVTEVCKNI